MYLQSLLTLTLLGVDHLHYQCLVPLRLPHLQVVHAMILVVLIATVTGSLILKDYETLATQGGLTAVAILMGVSNILVVAYILCFICFMYANPAKIRQLRLVIKGGCGKLGSKAKVAAKKIESSASHIVSMPKRTSWDANSVVPLAQQAARGPGASTA